MPGNNKYQDMYFLSRLKTGDEHAFDHFFNYYYPGLVLYADRFLNNLHLAEEIVQSVFMKLWKDRRALDIHSSVKAYLFRSVQNKCLDMLKHKKVRNKHTLEMMRSAENVREETWETYIETELAALILEAVDKLPPECKKIFRYSRIRNYSYKDISEKLGISVKTVENQIAKALKRLRIELKDYLP